MDNRSYVSWELMNSFLIDAFVGYGVPKEDAVYIGDSDVDYMTGKNSGIDFIGCDWGFRGEAFLREKGATVIAKKPADVLKLMM